MFVKGLTCLDSHFENTLYLRQLCARARGCVHVFTGQNISNDGDKGLQICVSPPFNEPSVYHGIKVWHASVLDARQRH